MEEDNKTVTMPLSEYEDMRAKLSVKELTEQQVDRKIEEVMVKAKEEKEFFIRNVIGMDELNINFFISQRKPFCKTLWQAFQFNLEQYSAEINKLTKVNEDLLKENTSLKKENQNLHEQINYQETKKKYKWWQIWKK